MNTNQPRGVVVVGRGGAGEVGGSLWRDRSAPAPAPSVFSVRVVMKERLSDRPSAL